MECFDAHCHLQDEDVLPHLVDILGRAAGAGVVGAMCCATSPADWDAVAALGERPGLRVSYGVHPWFLGDDADATLECLRERLVANPAAGVGEIGLDLRAEQAPAARQRDWCHRQLALSIDLERVASFHCVAAVGSLRDLLAAAGPHPRGIVLHGYPGPVEMVDTFIDLGASFSFGFTVGEERYRRQREAAAAVPDERLLVETDAPPGEPGDLPKVCAALAGLRGSTAAEIAALTTANARRLFDEEDA